MNDLVDVNSAFDVILKAAEEGNNEELLALSGQSDDSTPKQGLSRLNINYETETDDGQALKKGAWKIYHNGEFVYADTVDFRPLVRTYEWSTWDAEEGKFASRSVQAPSLNHQFPDTDGSNKCGRLTKSEEESLGSDHPLVLASRAATCNQVFYGILDMEGKNASGQPVKISGYPVMSYFKRSGFRPAREAIERLNAAKKVMNETVFSLSTERKKQGSVTYFVPVFEEKGQVKMDNEVIDTMKMFFETIKASNNAILEKYREASKLKTSKEEVDLAADFSS